MNNACRWPHFQLQEKLSQSYAKVDFELFDEANYKPVS